jgi:hypothetical protein
VWHCIHLARLPHFLPCSVLLDPAWCCNLLLSLGHVLESCGSTLSLHHWTISLPTKHSSSYQHQDERRERKERKKSKKEKKEKKEKKSKHKHKSKKDKKKKDKKSKKDKKKVPGKGIHPDFGKYGILGPQGSSTT